MRSTGSTAVEGATEAHAEHWRQLVCGVLCMVMIANLQYGWTLFVHPIDQKFHWGTTAIQVAFSIFIATETWRRAEIKVADAFPPSSCRAARKPASSRTAGMNQTREIARH